MNFVAALKFGSTPEVEAARCMKQLLYRSERKGELCLAFTAELINEIFKAIGLHTNITVQQLEAGKGFDWEVSGCHLYIFHCNSIFFNSFERFLMQLCRTAREEQENAATTEADSGPIKRVLQLLGIWCNCYTDLLEHNAKMQVQYLQEPLARLNYRLFLGVHKIRTEFHNRFQHLDEVCTHLFHNALNGLFFKECHAYIAEGLGALVEKDFAISNAFAEDACQYFYIGFSVEQQKATYCNLFKCLIRMLNNLVTQLDANIKEAFLNFLIEMRMQEIYYTVLKLEKTKRLLMAALKFLHELQGQLLDLDCFSKTFLEAILGLALHTDENVALTAAELYFSMARGKSTADDFLLKHILEYYFTEMNSIDSLPKYVAALWPNFTYMKTMRVYFDLLKDDNLPLAMHYFIAQFTIVAYRKMLLNFEKYAHEIIFVFQMLPAMLTSLNSQCLKGILLQLYSLTELEQLRGSCGGAKELLLDFEKYFILELKSGVHLQYPYLLNLFMQFARCIEETKNFEQLEMCGVYLYTKYMEIERSLAALDEKKTPSIAQVSTYDNILKKLCVLLLLDYDVLDTLDPLIRTLHGRLIEKPQLHELANKHQLFIDIYATELLVHACIKLSRAKDLTKTTQEWLAVEIRVLEKYLLDSLTNAGVKTNAEMNRLKTYFICLVDLYCTFHNSTEICNLPLLLRPYHVLVQTLLESSLLRKSNYPTSSQNVSEENMEWHSKYILQYQQFMFQKFTQLHSSKYVVLPSPAAWKLCLHYGLTSHKFNDELFAFMVALSTHQFRNFVHISAVLVYNLYKQKPPFKMDAVMSVIRAQKSFIDQLPSALSPNLLCANVVLQVFRILQESLQRLPPTTGENRLIALKHLNHYTWNLNVNADNVLPDICTQAKVLQNHMLNNAERKCLDTYLSALGGHTNAKEKPQSSK
ncbi:uncharacterized protein LOC128858929 isoform X1 [Anastrepha ludens]|uniref:uncharacterized protein LOC128858929 isoform X1 n=1 Tax=Anastrepha ludens TaxID=28586 RepID=UPI0023AEF66A|nr:uncharacterized protein LOC128858929 isoform X1 [Anastrepha ludens]XP_053951495.1 uncharacterized protein LOC128858929 isoform X1 [Anastrepha ludens]